MLARPHGPPGLHLGLVYAGATGRTFIHHGWEDRLWTDWAWPGVGAVPDEDPSRLRSAAAVCRQVRDEFRRTKKMPYGLAWNGTRFTPLGQLNLACGARGLTCATFVLAILRSAGIEVVDEPDWPERLDETSAFVDALAVFPPASVAVGMHAELAAGARRITPDEVLGACTVEPRPARFSDARAAADVALALLDGAAPA